MARSDLYRHFHKINQSREILVYIDPVWKVSEWIGENSGVGSNRVRDREWWGEKLSGSHRICVYLCMCMCICFPFTFTLTPERDFYIDIETIFMHTEQIYNWSQVYYFPFFIPESSPIATRVTINLSWNQKHATLLLLSWSMHFNPFIYLCGQAIHIHRIAPCQSITCQKFWNIFINWQFMCGSWGGGGTEHSG